MEFMQKNHAVIPNQNLQETVNDIVSRSVKAFEFYSEQPMGARKQVISAIRQKLAPYIEEIARLEFEETGFGNIQDKMIKLALAIANTPGIEDLETEATQGDTALTLYEYAPYGVVCSTNPSNNPIATLICNTIGMLAAGNVIINIPHPRCREVTSRVTNIIREVVEEVIGCPDLVISINDINKNKITELINHPDVSLVVTTGGRKLNNQSIRSSKRVIAAGQANPVVIVDETADIKRSARLIVKDASFDNNMLCITEKTIVVVSSVVEEFANELKKLGVYYVDNDEEMLSLSKVVLDAELSMNRCLEGKSANQILEKAGLACKRQVPLIVVNTFKKHPLVVNEMLMPIVPLVEARDFEEALEIAKFAEQNFRHTALIHSQSLARMSMAAKVLQTSLFIKNGSSLMGIGLQSNEKTSFTIANITGEGAISARNFTRRRSCMLANGFDLR